MIKPRDFRVPIMMSDEEMQAIDDWRFANRVATRSDAIRRLCQMALALDKSIPEAFERTLKLPDALATPYEAIGATQEELEAPGFSPTEYQKVFK